MPNAKVLEEKKQTVAEMTEKLKSKAGVFIDYRGITGIEATEMRAKLREENVKYEVIKNSLMRFAIKNVGFDGLDGILNGTTSLAVSNDDPIAPARVIKEYSDKLPDYFEIKAGFMDGKILSKDEVIAIASIPPLPVLQAQFLGTLLAPISKLAVVLKAAAEKSGGQADAEVAAEPAKDTEKAVEAVDKPAEEAKEAAEKPADEAEVTTEATEAAAEEAAAETAAEETKTEEKAAEDSPAEE